MRAEIILKRNCNELVSLFEIMIMGRKMFKFGQNVKYDRFIHETKQRLSKFCNPLVNRRTITRKIIQTK